MYSLQSNIMSNIPCRWHCYHTSSVLITDLTRQTSNSKRSETRRVPNLRCDFGKSKHIYGFLLL